MIGVECFEEVGASSVGSKVVCGGVGFGSGQPECVDGIRKSERDSVVHEEPERVGVEGDSPEVLRCGASATSGVGRPKMSIMQWKRVKHQLRLRLDDWARIIVYRSQNPGELYPPTAHFEIRSPGWKKFHPGAMVSGMMSEFVEVESALNGVPEVIKGVWLRMYGGGSLVRRERALRLVAGGCDLKAMADAVNIWEARVADRLGIIRDVVGEIEKPG